MSLKILPKFEKELHFNWDYGVHMYASETLNSVLLDIGIISEQRIIHCKETAEVFLKK